jgi:hypothetical protein
MSAADSGSLSPEFIMAELSAVRENQPLSALAATDSHRAALTEPLLQALERGLANPEQSFEKEGMLFNYATYLFAKWREPRAYPFFIRWFSMPGEGAFDIGGDTLTQDGARLLASVCGGDVEPIKALITNRQANEYCRGQAVAALAVLAAWGERSRQDVEGYFLHLAREGLEREEGNVWNELAAVSGDIEAFAVFPELRRAYAEGLIDPSFVGLERLDEVEAGPSDSFFKRFVEEQRPITDVAVETRWWSGFQHMPSSAVEGESLIGQPGRTYLAPTKVGRNDPCPCGSGKKYKKCCGK